MYSDDLPSLLHFNDEVIRWKRRWAALEVSSRPDTIAKVPAISTMKTHPDLSGFFLRLLVLYQLPDADARNEAVCLSG